MSRAFDFGQLVQLCRRTHEETHRSAARAADTYLVTRNWLFGWHIVEYGDGGADRSKLYGRKLIERLADELKVSGLRGCSPTNLRKFREFYRAYPEIQQTLSVEFRARLLAKIFHRLQEAGVKRCSTTHLKLCRQFHQQQKQIGQTSSDHFVFPLAATSPPIEEAIAQLHGRISLGWSHYTTLLIINNAEACRFYLVRMRQTWK